MARLSTHQRGFTLIELMICVAIIGILLALSAVNFGQTQTSVTVASATDTLLADLKSQQLLAMAGEMGSSTSAQPHGIFVQPNQYTLYASPSFSSSDSNNFVFSAPPTITLSSTFPSGKVLFNTGDGSVNGFVNGSNTITVAGPGQTTVIVINRLGAITVQ